MTSSHLLAMSTSKSWDDVALTEDAVKQVEEIKTWLKQFAPVIPKTIERKKKLKQGYRSLFFGAPGTGKKLTAALIGKELNMPVYEVDLSAWCQNILVKRKRTLR